MLERAALTKNRTATPDITKLVDGIKLVVGISGVVDKREAFRRLNERGKLHISQRQRKTTNGVFGGKRPVEFNRSALPLEIFTVLVVIFPGERNIGSRGDTKSRGHDGVDFLHELLFLRAKGQLHLFG